MQAMRAMTVGTIGNDISKMLTRHNLTVIPKFESHDLKHMVLGYGMSSIDEIRMQAYLLGNGNYSIFCVLFLASGILFPGKFSAFYRAYKMGRIAPSILHLSIDDCMMLKTTVIKSKYNGLGTKN